MNLQCKNAIVSGSVELNRIWIMIIQVYWNVFLQKYWEWSRPGLFEEAWSQRKESLAMKSGI